jgi:hypothetical protein
VGAGCAFREGHRRQLGLLREISSSFCGLYPWYLELHDPRNHTKPHGPAEGGKRVDEQGSSDIRTAAETR